MEGMSARMAVEFESAQEMSEAAEFVVFMLYPDGSVGFRTSNQDVVDKLVRHGWKTFLEWEKENDDDYDDE